MISNYLKIAWRNLFRRKAFSAINVFGLALGITCSLLILLWVQDERRMDDFHANGKQLFQVYERQHYDGKVDAGYHTQGLLAAELKRVVPEVKYASGLDFVSQPGIPSTLACGDRSGKMNGLFAGADFFSMFSFPLLEGTAQTALNTPSGIAISRNMAAYFFGGSEKALGKIIRFEDKEDLLVTAVFENPPIHSSLQFDFLRSWTDFARQNEWLKNWGNSSPATFIQLQKNADPMAVEARICNFIYRYKQPDPGSLTELALQPYPEKYLHSAFKNGRVSGGRIAYVRLFTFVAAFILLLACINFMNLSTAQAYGRSREVGLRKVIGALRSSLIGQFLGEALLVTFFAAVIAIALSAGLLPAFNALTGKQLSIPFAEPFFWVNLGSLLILTGLVAGSYPALFLSSLNPIGTLKGSLRFGRGTTSFRKGLVVFQFTLSILMIIAMMVIYRQIHFIQNKNLGYDRDNLLYIPIEGNLTKNYDLFKTAAEKIPGVLSMSKMRNSPTVIEHHTGGVSWPGKDPNIALSFADAVVGYDFTKTMRLTVAEGRDFSTAFGSDSLSFMLNETAVQKMGLQHPIGQTISWGNREGKVIGVVRDFHFSSLHQAIDPLIVRLDENWSWGTILVRSDPRKIKEVLTGLEKIYADINPKFPFTYQFSDEEYARLYQSEAVVSRLANCFALLAIFISCLGLFGLAAFTAAQRRKEIGVRKVLGASAASVLALLSRAFIKLILVAFCIAVPLAWYMMNQWLSDYAYRISMDWRVFAIAGLLTTGIAFLTISFQGIKAALTNPVKSLRTE